MPVMALLAGCSDVEVERGANAEPISDGWLGRFEDDAERFRALEGYLGGFSSAMWEVGERYRHLHQALEDDNLPLASYHFEKIGDAIRNGYRKRPARQANSDALFMDAVFEPAGAAFAEGDQAAAWQAFEQVRAACIACHVAEDVTFMNDQPMLRDLRAP
ncbi:MAG: hypothetical protein EA417_20295 [Gammaproteobacteria bacterium]|nr:MAG: hypothetical protein EA417_20295 [Gammaproteobacteria bacterium]